MNSKKVSIPLIHEMDEKPPEIAHDESLPEGTIYLHLIDQKEGRYRLVASFASPSVTCHHRLLPTHP
jgi:hypothetical protein